MSKRHSRSRRNRRLRRNAEGADSGIIQRLVVPSLVGTAGMMLASWLSENVVGRLLTGQDPKVLMLITGAGGGALAVAMGSGIGMSDEVSQALATGMGIAAVMPYVPRLMSTVQTTPTQNASASANMSGFGDPLIDTAHYGAPYQGMLGLGGPMQPPAVSTVIPVDLALQMKVKKQIRRIREPFASADRGYAGGVFARQLFSGS
jgi:hypothetical protein